MSDNTPTFKLSVDATTAMFGAYFAQAEIKVSETGSLIAHVGYIDTRITVNPDVNQLPGWAAHIGLGARGYLSGNCMSGFFFQDYVAFDYIRTYSGAPVLFFGSTVGPNIYGVTNFANIGYSWVSDMGFFADGMAGINTTVLFGAPNLPTFGQMTTLETRINLGWAF